MSHIPENFKKNVKITTGNNLAGKSKSEIPAVSHKGSAIQRSISEKKSKVDKDQGNRDVEIRREN